MIDLYLVFFLVGGIVFAGIVWYSASLQRGRDRAPREEYVDPLFAELEDSKAKQKSLVDDNESVPAEQDLAPAVEAADLDARSERVLNDTDLNVDVSNKNMEFQKQEPRLLDELVADAKDSAVAEKSQIASSRSDNRELLPVIDETAPEKFGGSASEPVSEQQNNQAVAETASQAEQVGADSKVDPKIDPRPVAPENANQQSDASQETTSDKPNTPKEPLVPELKNPVASKPAASRPKAKSFTQKLVERVAQRSAAKQARDKKAPKSAALKTVKAQAASKASMSQRASTSPEIVGKPKLDKRSSSIVTELVARVKNSEPIEQQNLLSLFRAHDFKFHRKVHIYGLNQLTDMWRDIEFEMPSARFVELGVSIQLADRDGAMTDKELHDFQQMTLEFSNNFDAPFEFSMDIDEALKQAQLLDQIGRRYDSMAVLNVVPKNKSGFRMADIESCARDLMMSTDKNGIFMKTEGQKHDVSVLYRLACTDGSGHFGLSSNAMGSVHDLVVYMNVPATADPEGVFQQMVKDANSLATWLEGKVVDRAGRAMTQRSYSTLMQQISDIAFSMQQDGLIPGDEISKKLF